jgi:hypothetical protein
MEKQNVLGLKAAGEACIVVVGRSQFVRQKLANADQFSSRYEANRQSVLSPIEIIAWFSSEDGVCFQKVKQIVNVSHCALCSPKVTFDCQTGVGEHKGPAAISAASVS